ncbi:MAG: histidine phosphatase family protein [Candidatus Binatia bacterium]
MTTRVLLVRHGATELSAEDRFAGATDVALSEVGREQARRLAERLRQTPIAAAFASPLGRTLETAGIITAPHGISVQPEAAFREIDHGHWEAHTRAEVESAYAAEYKRWELDPYTFAPSGGESGLAVTARALPALIAVVAAHPDASVLIVSHKATIRLLISALLGFDPRRYRDHLDQSPAALNIVDFKDPVHARLTLFNSTAHYAEDAVPEVPQQRLSKAWQQ